MLNITRDLTAKKYGNRKDAMVQGIILHDTCGAGTDADAHYLANDPEHRNVSVDFVASRENLGTVYQLNPDLKKFYTFHAGRSTKFKNYKNGNVNLHSIGIEISQKVKLDQSIPLWPPAQIECVAELCVKLCRDFNLTKTDITTHQAIITDGSRTDPRQFPWSTFWAYFISASVNGPTTTPALVGKVYYTVGFHDTLWSISNKYHVSIEDLKRLNHMDTMESQINLGQQLLIRE